MIKLPNWLTGLRPALRIKIVQKGLWLRFIPDPSGPPAPAPGSNPEPMAYYAGEIAITFPAAGGSSLLEMVREALGGPQDEEPKAAVLAVARWFRDGGNSAYAALLEREADT